LSQVNVALSRLSYSCGMHLLDLPAPVPTVVARDDREECAFLGALTRGSTYSIVTTEHDGVAVDVIATLRPDGKYLVTVEIEPRAHGRACTQSLVLAAGSVDAATAAGLDRGRELVEQFAQDAAILATAPRAWTLRRVLDRVQELVPSGTGLQQAGC